MQVFRGFDDSSVPKGCVLAIGNFDGVHRGHQKMLSRLLYHAHDQGVKSLVLTFDPHPITLLRPEHTPPRLSTLSRKLELIGHAGVDVTIAYPTDRALLDLSAESFFQQIVVDRLQAIGMVEGPNFYFGKERSGNVESLRLFCEDAGLFLDVVAPEVIDGEMISSSRIRELIRAGQIELACRLLGHPYQVEGTVVSGARRGQTLGFPTANLNDVSTLLPAEGVYAGVAIVERHQYPAAIHVGPNPTFDDDARKLEVHLIGYSGDLYGEPLKVDFLAEIRPVVRFASADDLRQQLNRDIEAVRRLVSDSREG